MWKIIVFCAIVLLGCANCSPRLPHHSLAHNEFENEDGQDQTMQAILLAIEERLRNLENMALSHTSPSSNKFQTYYRKLDMIDVKINRLEELMMVNLDKISESISNKTYKDDMARTNTYRKMDAIYEGISYRLSYVDRKLEMSFDKAQAKAEMILTRLEKIDDSMADRDADIEAELSDAIFALDDLKTSQNVIGESVLNVTKMILPQQDSEASSKNCSSLENILNTGMQQNLRLMENISMQFSLVLENNDMLKTMKAELKEDFNDYANKVADMNSDVWRSSDVIEDDLKNIATDLQTILTHIGKTPNDSLVNDDETLSDFNDKMESQFEKILSNQDIFLSSCYRLQMDESQIESEISNTLEKLINMFQKKSAIEMRDMKSLESLIRNHHRQVQRTVQETNNNILAFYDNSTRNSQQTHEELKTINNNLGIIFSAIQSNGTKNKDMSSKQLLQEINLLSIHVHLLMQQTNDIVNITNRIVDMLIRYAKSNGNQTDEYIKNIYHILTTIDSKINKSYLDYYFNKYNIDAVVHRFGIRLSNYIKNIKAQNLTNITKALHEMGDNENSELMMEIFGISPNLITGANATEQHQINTSTEQINLKIGQRKNDTDIVEIINEIFRNNVYLNTTLGENLSSPNEGTTENSCTQNYVDILDIRSRASDCKTSLTNETKITGEAANNSANTFHTFEENDFTLIKTDSTTKLSPVKAKEINLQDINNQKHNMSEEIITANGTKCVQNYSSVIDVRFDANDCNTTTNLESLDKDTLFNNTDALSINTLEISETTTLEQNNNEIEDPNENVPLENVDCFDIDVRNINSEEMMLKCQPMKNNSKTKSNDNTDCFNIDFRNIVDHTILKKCNKTTEIQEIPIDVRHESTEELQNEEVITIEDVFEDDGDNNTENFSE